MIPNVYWYFILALVMYSTANTFLTSLRSSLPSDLDLPENAATIVGKVRIEEKAKLKDRLQKCREFVHLPLMEFAECLRTEGDSDTKHVEDGVPLWEAAACWVSCHHHLDILTNANILC